MKKSNKINYEKPVLSVLSGNNVFPPPIWIMRQAGRYLPEYREIRKKANSFLDLCYNPDMASAITLQPIQRFGMDAAIMFSDILVIPDALGQKVLFVENEGPRLDPISNYADLRNLQPNSLIERLEAVFLSIGKTKSQLDYRTTLIGFCGAPWTVASYMIAGKGTPDQAPARVKAYTDPQFITDLIDILVEMSINYLSAQIRAGVEVIQIFESFGAGLSPDLFDLLSFEPVSRIIRGIKNLHKNIPVIVFVRGTTTLYTQRFAECSMADAIGIDWATPLDEALLKIGTKASQGNLDPMVLLAGGKILDESIKQILKSTEGRPHIFNLGHGIVPQTPIEHVEYLVKRVRDGI